MLQRLLLMFNHKPRDTHPYFNFKLCHPQNVKKVILYSQGLRLKILCNSEDVYKTREEEFKRGFVDEQIGRVNCLGMFYLQV